MGEVDGDEEEEEEEEEAEGPPQLDAAGNPVPRPAKKKKKGRGGKRRNLSSKPQDFQVRTVVRYHTAWSVQPVQQTPGLSGEDRCEISHCMVSTTCPANPRTSR